MSGTSRCRLPRPNGGVRPRCFCWSAGAAAGPVVRPGCDYLSARADHDLPHTPYGQLAAYELTDIPAAWDELHRQAVAHLPHRVHPTAYVHPNAVIGDDVIIGPHARVWEFSTVRAGSRPLRGRLGRLQLRGNQGVHRRRFRTGPPHRRQPRTRRR
ncbi:hypothetical protein [Streptomyces sp. E11-3]|uniref:hypothetical protein n=1 Tax=Streptomyces sp. E11-3 TaxID=3110112 RepID=UPI00397FBD64